MSISKSDAVFERIVCGSGLAAVRAGSEAQNRWVAISTIGIQDNLNVLIRAGRLVPRRQEAFGSRRGSLRNPLRFRGLAEKRPRKPQPHSRPAPPGASP